MCRTFSIGGYTLSNTAVTSVTDAIKTPNTYYYSGNSWYNFADISLWSDYGTNKSIYDPCPYGSRVPKNGSWNSWTSHSQTWPDGDINGGIALNGTWWPAAGLRNNGSGTIGNSGYSGFYWSSTYASAYNSYNLGFNYGGYVNPSTAGNRSNSLSVRCVQETGTFRMKNEKWDLGALFVEGDAARPGGRGVGIVCTAHQGVGVPWRCYATTADKACCERTNR